METFPFTNRRVEEAACPPGKSRAYFRDARSELQLAVMRAGTKVFFVRRRVNGTPIRHKLGEYPAMSVETARKEAAKQVSKMVSGIDPRAERREMRAGQSLQEAFDDYTENWAKLRKKTWQDDIDQFDRYLASWKSRRLVEIERHHVAALHTKVGKEHGFYAANRLLALLHSLFAWAARHRGFKGVNPATGIQKFPEKKRERFLLPEELPRFCAAVDAEPNETIRDFVYIALFVGARRSNVQAMAWADIDFESRTWAISDTKSGKPVLLPLSEPAVAILRRRREGAGDSPYVFPGRSRGHLMEPKAAWAKILERADIKDLRIHDLRRTFGSYQAINGSSLPIIGQSLGHTSTAATSVYARLHLQSVRQSVEEGAKTIIAAATKSSNRTSS